MCERFPAMNRPFVLQMAAIVVIASLGAPFARAAERESMTASLRARAVAALRDSVHREKRWVKVHAAEYLLQAGYPQGVQKAFDEEWKLHGEEPRYRIGICRVLARAADNENDRDAWTKKIASVFFDAGAPDRPHAAETLAKLGYQLAADEIAEAEKAADPKNPAIASCATWVLVNSGVAGAERRFAAMLGSPNVDVRCDAAYGFRHLKEVSDDSRQKLLAAVQREPATSRARVFLVAAAVVHAPAAKRGDLTKELVHFAEHGGDEERFQACETAAAIGDASMLPMLTRFLDDSNADIRSAAANGILRIGRRASHSLGGLDWAVIAGYALAMLGIGWYFSRKNKTCEDYLLGNRQMRPMMVGISLFASLISTVSYLAWPGEIIKNGPMIICTLLSYPLIGLVVGRLIIPYIMRLKVTSAYEILELRLGGAVRTLGSVLFLLLRLLWMSVIVYATSSKVLVPLLGLDPHVTPLLCLALAVMTIVYTVMGGLRAVVVTDVVQAAILFGAAIATVVTITVCLGGVGAWWPHAWPPYWPKPVFGHDPSARVTLFGAMLATFTWYVCTSASDQIAIQRYLATRDATAARTVLYISLAADVVVSCVLAAVGLGLLAYFNANPHLLADGQTALGDSDKLFTQYILVGLPTGVCGLVIAGLLACATSSLAAGINSTSSVIMVDILDRFRKTGEVAESRRMRQVKYISAAVGVFVVLLSLFVNMVHGNLLEVAYKVVNLLTAPLAGLFFLAMFVPWARGFGAIIGAIVGTAVVVAVNYWTDMTGRPGISFLWAMPLSLVAEVGVGAMVSLVPIGSRGQPITAVELSDESP